MCPYCKAVKEQDRDHIWNATTARSKLKWRLNFITSTRKRYDDMKMREMLRMILTNGSQAWFTETALQRDTYPHTFRQLLQEQTDIGWRQLLFNVHILDECQQLQN
jgi:methylphosphotriester-DNA--protein-cysteine methyltransferase